MYSWYHWFILAGGKKSVAALPNEERAESPTQAAAKDPDEKLIIDSHDNGVKALAKIVSFSEYVLVFSKPNNMYSINDVMTGRITSNFLRS